jgi:hypothetical protein
MIDPECGTHRDSARGNDRIYLRSSALRWIFLQCIAIKKSCKTIR